MACALAGPLTDRQRPVFGGSLGDLFGFTGFQLLEPQFELLDLPGQPLRGAAELHPPQLGDLEFELLDFQSTQLYGELCRLQLGGRRCQFALAGHGKSPQRVGSEGRSAEASDIARLYRMWPKVTRTNRESLPCQTSMGRGGAGGAIVRRQSIASISSANCAGVKVNALSTIGGQTNLLRSSRLANRHRPLPSQYYAFR
jgi:hypothetical protein